MKPLNRFVEAQGLSAIPRRIVRPPFGLQPTRGWGFVLSQFNARPPVHAWGFPEAVWSAVGLPKESGQTNLETVVIPN